MKTLIALSVLVSLALAQVPPSLRQSTYINFGTPVTTSGLTLEKFKSGNAMTQTCAIMAWAGTAVVFASIPWADNPKWQPWMKAAAGVAVAGMFGVYASAVFD